jgi:hypothetical protein
MDTTRLLLLEGRGSLLADVGCSLETTAWLMDIGRRLVAAAAALERRPCVLTAYQSLLSAQPHVLAARSSSLAAQAGGLSTQTRGLAACTALLLAAESLAHALTVHPALLMAELGPVLKALRIDRRASAGPVQLLLDDALVADALLGMHQLLFVSLVLLLLMLVLALIWDIFLINILGQSL